MTETRIRAPIGDDHEVVRTAIRDPSRPLDPAPEEEEVREQLGRILASSDFARSERLRSFLGFLVEESLAGRADRLRGYRLGIEVFGRGEDFDPRTDSLVRNHAGRLRRALEHYYLTEGAADPVRVEVPEGGYRPRFSRFGPAAHPEAAESGAPAAGGNRRLEPRRGLELRHGPALAVMPLRNLGDDPEDTYFAQGLTEELIVQLARFRSLRVLGLHTAAGLGAGAGDPAAAARELGVRYLVRGSVQRSNGRARIAVHLVDGRDGSELWAEHYEQPLSPDNLLAVEDDITARVTARLADAYGALTEQLARDARRRGPREMEAYDAVLRCHHCQMNLTPASFRETGEALERTVAAEPDYALAVAMLSDHYLDDDKLMFFTVEDPLPKAWELARRAVRLEPELQFAQWAMAVNHLHRRQLDEFFELAELALELNPNSAYMVGAIGWAMALAGAWERGLAVLAKGQVLNPRHPGWFHAAPCFNHLRQGELEPALAAAQAINMPAFPWDPALRASILGRLGRRQEARAALGELLALDPDFPRHARRYLSGYIVQDELIDRVFAGLERAGMASP